MRHGSLFSGIGGFDLAAQWMGWENVFHCEWNPFGQRVLKYYWPKAISYYDITKTDFTVHRGSIDILTGGFPCQPYSTAGKRLGKADERHLWPEMLRAIREIRPRWVVGENVLGLVNWSDGLVFEEVCAALEAEGYEVQPFVLAAAAVNAPHRRDRIFFIAHARNDGDSRDAGEVSGKATQTNRGREEPSTTSGEQVQLSDKSSALLGDVAYSNCGRMQESILQHTDISTRPIRDNKQTSQNTIRDGCLRGEFIEEGADIREQRDISAGDTKRICGEEMAGAAAESMRHRIDKSGYRGQSEQLDTDGIEGGTISDTDGKMLEYRHGKGTTGQRAKQEKRIKPFDCTRGWETFPTVSPLCDGNDGISDRLDGITFSKWRNESIKGGGNAIVPQVVLQIFKAIEEYEGHNH